MQQIGKEVSRTMYIVIKIELLTTNFAKFIVNVIMIAIIAIY